MELLAPVGSFASFEAALDEGADAVYVGAPELNARALSRDFTYTEIKAMIRQAAQTGVKFYIAMNSLLKEDEVARAVECLAYLEELKPDALIIQDLGLFYLAQKYFPGLDLHASTLMSVHNSLAVKQLVDQGFKRVVLPREMSIAEIGILFRKTGAELEVFIHGAMCFSYSGLCMFSSLHGGKSSLRGQCVQPCRRKYTWQKKKGRSSGRQSGGRGAGYLFSMNDLSGIQHLEELADAGVASLKIEGRLKSGEYVRKTVRAYRLMLDNLTTTPAARKKIVVEARRLLDEAMGRKRSSGFFLNSRPQQAITPHLSGNIGTMVGKVHSLDTVSLKGGKQFSVITVSLRHPVSVGDRLRLHNEKSGERTNFTLKSLKVGQRAATSGKAGQKVRITLQQKVPGRSVKMFQGSLFRVDVSTGRQDEKRSRERLLKPQIKKIAPDTNRVESILADLSGKSPLTQGRYVPHGVCSGKKMKTERLQWWVKVGSIRDMNIRLPVRPEKYVLPLGPENLEDGLRLFKKYNGFIVWSLPPIIMEENLGWYSRALATLEEKGYREFQSGHFSQSGMFSRFNEKQHTVSIYGNYTVNILNSPALEEMRELGFAGVQFSIETDGNNLDAALKNFNRMAGKVGGDKTFLVGLYVYGRPPLFTARLDDPAYNYGKRFVSPRGEEYVLSRNNDMTIARSVIPFDLLDNQKKLEKTGIDYLLVDLSDGNMKKNVSEFITHYSQKGKRSAGMSGNFSANLA